MICHMKKKIRKIDKKNQILWSFSLSLLPPFFKNILGFFFTATNTHIALSWSFPMLPRPLYLLPRPFQQQPIWIIKIPCPHKNTKKEAKWYHHIRKKKYVQQNKFKKYKVFFHVFFKKKSCFSHATTTCLLLFYISICRKWNFLFLFTTSGVYKSSTCSVLLPIFPYVQQQKIDSTLCVL